MVGRSLFVQTWPNKLDPTLLLLKPFYCFSRILRSSFFSSSPADHCFSQNFLSSLTSNDLLRRDVGRRPNAPCERFQTKLFPYFFSFVNFIKFSTSTFCLFSDLYKHLLLFFNNHGIGIWTYIFEILNTLSYAISYAIDNLIQVLCAHLFSTTVIDCSKQADLSLWDFCYKNLHIRYSKVVSNFSSFTFPKVNSSFFFLDLTPPVNCQSPARG